MAPRFAFRWVAVAVLCKGIVALVSAGCEPAPDLAGDDGCAGEVDRRYAVLSDADRPDLGAPGNVCDVTVRAVSGRFVDEHTLRVLGR